MISAKLGLLVQRVIFWENTLTLQSTTVPPTTGQPPTGLIVVLHGWGANAQDLAPLTSLLQLPDYQFILPNAPFPHPYASTGRAWYDFQRNNDGLAVSRQQLSEWLQSLEQKTQIPLSRTILCGFSQGAAMTLDVGLNVPFAGLIALSGYLHPITQLTNQAIPPVLIVHGRQDSVVPLSAAQNARDSLIKLGVSVEYQEFDMGHEVRPAALERVRSFILEAMMQSTKKAS